MIIDVHFIVDDEIYSNEYDLLKINFKKIQTICDHFYNILIVILCWSKHCKTIYKSSYYCL